MPAAPRCRSAAGPANDDQAVQAPPMVRPAVRLHGRLDGSLGPTYPGSLRCRGGPLGLVCLLTGAKHPPSRCVGVGAPHQVCGHGREDGGAGAVLPGAHGLAHSGWVPQPLLLSPAGMGEKRGRAWVTLLERRAWVSLGGWQVWCLAAHACSGHGRPTEASAGALPAALCWLAPRRLAV